MLGTVVWAFKPARQVVSQIASGGGPSQAERERLGKLPALLVPRTFPFAFRLGSVFYLRHNL